jgi:hypothetical protein
MSTVVYNSDMSNQKKTLGVVLLVVIYAVVALIGFFIIYFIKTQLDHKKEVPAQVTKQQTIPTPIPGESKTYKDPSANFALNYPADLSVKETPYGLGVNAVELRSSDNIDKEYAPNVQMLTVPKALAKAVGQDFDGYYAMADNTTKVIASPLGTDKTSEAFTKIRNREVNKLRALDYSSVPSPNTDNEDPEIGTFIEAGDTLIIISTGESDRDSLEDILKTFTYPL